MKTTKRNNQKVKPGSAFTHTMKSFYAYEKTLTVRGLLALIYSEFGIGKSVSTIETAEDPIDYIFIEPRDPMRYYEAAEQYEKEVKFTEYNGWNNLFSYLNIILESPESYYYETQDGSKKNIKTIVLDSISYLMNVELTFTLIDERIEAKGEGAKQLVDRGKMSLEGFGSLSNNMKRLFRLLGRLSAQGYIVICLASLEEKPKYNRDLQAGPSLSGRDFSKVIGHYCDLIGLLETRHWGDYEDFEKNGHTENEKRFPPFVYFEGDGSFLCKVTGSKLRGLSPMPFRIDEIVKRC